MTDTNPSSEPLAGADGNVPAADGGETVSAEATLAELNKILGGSFKDLPSALKAVQDTKSFVGKRKEDIKAEVLQEIAPAPKEDSSGKLEEELGSIKTRLFYSENPQYKGYESLIASMGTDPAKVVESEPFKMVFQKVSAADEMEQKQSVIHSSSRIAQVKSVTDEAVAIANGGGNVDSVAAALARGINSVSTQG